MQRTRNARWLQRIVACSFVAGVGLIAAAPMAMADPCPPLDLSCVLEDTTTTVGDVLEDTTTTAGGVVTDTTTTAGQVLEDTTTGAGGVLEDTTTTVEGVLEDTTTTVGGVLEETTTVVEGAVPDGMPTDPLPGGDGVIPVVPQEGGSTTTGGGAQHGAGTSSASTPTSAGSVPGSFEPTLGERAAAIVGHPFPLFLDSGPSGALLFGERLVRTVAFPAALIVLVFCFVAVQNRIDRKDPKLAIATVGSEYMTFS